MLGKQTVFALRDISEGEELTVSYLGDLEQTRAERQASLSADFGFEERQASLSADFDKKMVELQQLRRRTQEATDPSRAADRMRAALASGADPQTSAGQQKLRALQQQLYREGLEPIEARVRLLEKLGGVHSALAWNTFEAAAMHCQRFGRADEAKRWMARAAKCALLALGRESTEFQRFAAAMKGEGATSATRTR